MSELQISSPQHSNTKPRAKKIARRVFTVVGVVVCVLLLLLVLCNVTLIIKSYVNPNEIPSLFSISQMYVFTDSMAPAIRGNDLIFIKKVAPQTIAVGDVIAFYDPQSEEEMLIAHRVTDIITDEQGDISFFTKGDNNEGADIFAVPADNLVGKYVFRLRGMGKVAMFLQSTAGVIVSVSIPLFLLVGFELLNYIHRAKLQDGASNSPQHN